MQERRDFVECSRCRRLSLVSQCGRLGLAADLMYSIFGKRARRLRLTSVTPSGTSVVGRRCANEDIRLANVIALLEFR